MLSDLGMTGDKLSTSGKKKKVSVGEQSPSRTCSSLGERSLTSPLPSMSGSDSYSSGSGSYHRDMNSVHSSFQGLSFEQGSNTTGTTDLDSLKRYQNNNLTRLYSGAKKYGLKDFNFIKVLGKGSFGKVC